MVDGHAAISSPTTPTNTSHHAYPQSVPRGDSGRQASSGLIATTGWGQGGGKASDPLTDTNSHTVRSDLGEPESTNLRELDPPSSSLTPSLVPGLVSLYVDCC